MINNDLQKQNMIWGLMLERSSLWYNSKFSNFYISK